MHVRIQKWEIFSLFVIFITYNFLKWLFIIDYFSGTKFKDAVDEKTGQKIKIAILPDGTELRFFTDEDLESI